MDVDNGEGWCGREFAEVDLMFKFEFEDVLVVSPSQTAIYVKCPTVHDI